MSLAVHLDDENKIILVLDEGPTRGLDDTVLTAEAKYPINLHIQEKKFCILIEATVSCILMQ